MKLLNILVKKPPFLWDNSPTSPAQILRLCTHFHRAFLKKDKVWRGRSWRRQGADWYNLPFAINGYQ